MIRKYFIPVLVFLALPAFASTPKRKPASEKPPLVLDLSAPSAQRLENAPARAALEYFTAQLPPDADSDRKNLAELREQTKSLQRRGFSPLHEPLDAFPVFSAAQSFTVHREHDVQNVAAMNGDAAYQLLELSFYYSQHFTENGKKPTPSSLQPELVLKGTLFVHCAGSEGCSLNEVSVDEIRLRWNPFPSGRGANSSAGGAGRN